MTAEGGFAQALGPCYSCGELFAFSPTKVPSLVVEGVARPICRTCVEFANPIREAGGLDPIPILPGAYEPDRVEELGT